MEKRDDLRTARGCFNAFLIGIVFWMLLLAPFAFAGTAFLKGSYVSGMNRICLYDHLGSTVAYTIRASQVCPVTIQV